MKHLIPTTIVAASLLAAFTAGAETLHRAKIKNIEYKFIDTPRFGLLDTPDRSQDPSPRQWLEIEAEVEVVTLHKSEFIPELTALWHVVVDEPDYDRTNKGKAQSVRLTGETTFLDVRTREQKAFLVAYVHPDTLARITGREHPGNQDIHAVALTLSAPNLASTEKDGRDLAKATAEPRDRWWETWDRKTYKDLVLPKHQTPFAPLWTDRHPRVKRR